MKELVDSILDVKPRGNTTVVSVRMPTTLLARLDNILDSTHENRTGLINKILESGVRQIEGHFDERT